ncbi:MAG: ABC transporter substrate-binding protein, partial [Okeania sp. SIO2H7]|nr:ABC transporter substrate-binding protein [Okeania sp. SIO2H7]
QKYLLENAVMVPLYSPGWLSNYVTAEDVEGFKVAVFNRPVFNDVKLASFIEEKEEFLEEEKPAETSVEEDVKESENVESDTGEVLEEEKPNETSEEEEVNTPEATSE